MAVQLALELGIDERDRGRAPGRGRRQRQHGGAGTPEILVRRIDHHIGVGGIMDGGDLAVADADGFVQHLHHRRQAVGGAGCRGEQAMLPWLIEMIVDTDDNIERASLLHRGGDDHALHAASEVAVELLGLEEFAGAFEHHIAAEVAPGDGIGGRFGTEADTAIAD